MTATSPAPAAPDAPGRRPRRRTLLWAGIAVVVLAVLALLVGPRLYAASQEGNAAAPLAPASQAPAATEVPVDDPSASGSASPDATEAPAAPAAVADGTWAVSGGTAGYRVDEVLNGQDVTVTGRTEQVSGSFTTAGGVLTAGEVAVDLASVTTDSGARDAQFRRIVGVDANPAATFVLSAPVPLGGLAEVGSSVAVTLPGALTVNGQARDVQVAATAELTGEGAVTVTGAIPVTWADHGVEAPDLAIVKVEDTGTLEFQVQATRG